MKIATYVFIDLETTGLPREELNKTRICELSMVTVSREQLEATRPGASPRVQDKLTLCFNPHRTIDPGSTDTTGLDNYLLESKAAFNTDVCNIINTFLNILPKPVCLIAQNGMGFDFPIIKNHFLKLNMDLAGDVMCADSYHAFYDILEAKKKEDNEMMYKSVSLTLASEKLSHSVKNDTLNNRSNEESKQDLNEDKNFLIQLETLENEFQQCNELSESKSSYINPKASSTPISKDPQNILETSTVQPATSIEDLSLADNCNEMKMLNQTTPKKTTKQVNKAPRKNLTKIDKVRRRIPWPKDERPKESYKLKHIYERLLNRPATEAHRAENDCIYMMEAVVVIGKDFGLWVDENCVPFADIKPMTLGVPLGY